MDEQHEELLGQARDDEGSAAGTEVAGARCPVDGMAQSLSERDHIEAANRLTAKAANMPTIRAR